MKTHLFATLSTLITLAAVSGCGATRDVKVSGTVATSSTNGANGPVRIEFYEPAGSADAAASTAPELRLVDSATLQAAGPFQQTVSMQGNKLYVVAIVDTDHNGACTAGESWGEAIVTVGTDDTATATVSVTPEAHCLPMSTPE